MPVYSLAQTDFPNTVSFDAATPSSAASIDQVSWIAGSWRGEAMGGLTEEVWSDPLGGSMMGSFKFLSEGKVKFYELQVISEVGNSLILRLKHFHSDMKGWEEKDETVDFKFVKIKGNKVYFDDLTFEMVGDNEMNVYVVIGSEGKEEEVKFNYKRD